MVKRVQLPVVGGVRKSVIVKSDEAGTTIAEFGSQTVTLAQLKAALGISSQTIVTGAGGGAAPPAAIALGPGLSGGGSLLGSVPIRLSAPIPANLDDSFAEETIPIPGPAGPVGAQGPAGPALFVLAEDSVEEVVFIMATL